MKRIICHITLGLCLLAAVFLTGCGIEEEPQYFDIQSEETKFYDVAKANEGFSTQFLNMQFYQEEPVQIWAVYDGRSSMNVYLYRMDGSRELLMENLINEYVHGGGFLDQESNYYYWAVNQNNIIKLDSSGEWVFSRPLSELGIFRINKLCQLEDGRLYARCAESSEGGPDKLYEMDPATGDIKEINNDISFLYIDDYISAGEGGLLYLEEGGVRTVHVQEGTQEEVWTFRGTCFALEFDQFYPIWDFRIKEDGSLELLQAKNDSFNRGANSIVKTLRKVAAGEGKEIVVLRGGSLIFDTWLKDCVSRFNRQSSDWYVALEECPSVSDQDIQEEYAKQTSVEIASGKGPDILYQDVLEDYSYGIFQKGGFAELGPYLEASGINKEDFFPYVFSRWQKDGKIYSASVCASFWTTGYGGILMDREILGEDQEPEIGTLVEALLARQEDRILMSRIDSAGVLELLLRGTEDLWGMVDWEKGKCDFDTELFAGIMETAKRYGDRRDNELQPLAEQESYEVYRYLDSSLLEEAGKIRAGILFDDGCHGNLCEDRCMTFVINVNSDQKEGAWAFIEFMLEEGIRAGETSTYPAGRNAFDTMMEREMSRKLYTEEDSDYEWYAANGYYYLTEERIAELREILEDARFAPVRTHSVLGIIYEEAQGYFSGGKSIDDTINIINNRVQVYLDEGLQ